MPRAIWLAQDGAEDFVQDQYSYLAWYSKVNLTSIVLSMAVNALVTGLIGFRIVKATVTSVERALGSTGNTTKLRHVIFVTIIESGMALFAIQLVRVMLYNLTVQTGSDYGYPLIIGINQMFNVIIRSAHFYFFFLLIKFTWLGHHTNNNFGADLNEIVL